MLALFQRLGFERSAASFWRRVFRFKGIWNMLLTTGIFAMTYWRSDSTLNTFAVDITYRELFLALAFVFGAGYFRLATAPQEHRLVIEMGIWGQLAVFAVTLFHVLSRPNPLPSLYLIPAIVDLLFAGLFIQYWRGEWGPSSRA